MDTRRRQRKPRDKLAAETKTTILRVVPRRRDLRFIRPRSAVPRRIQSALSNTRATKTRVNNRNHARHAF